MPTLIHQSFQTDEVKTARRFYVPRTARRLMSIITILNLTGIACLSGATSDVGVARSTPVMPRASVMSATSLLDSIGFTLMLPGVFFATIAFLCGRAFTWSDEAARIVWYACALVINLIIGWKIGTALDKVPRA